MERQPMSEQAPRAILWDMDGTLLDSAEYHWLAWREVMEQEGRPITYHEFARSFGQRNDTILRGYFGNNISPERMERITEEKESRYRHLVRTRGGHLLPGVQRWLNVLHASGWRQAVASAAPRRNVETVLDVLDIGSFFSTIVAAEDVERGKPDPQVFLLAARRVETPPERCVVIEDAPAGIEAAHRAGMRTIGVQTTHHDLHADQVVRSLNDLPDNTFEHLFFLQGESKRETHKPDETGVGAARNHYD